MTRPPQPYEPPAGLAWVARPAPGWSLVTDRPCRARVPGVGKVCRAPAVAALNRGKLVPHLGRRVDALWPYCPDHLYGKWIENGLVLRWILEPS
jgi:hypothetical protein